MRTRAAAPDTPAHIVQAAELESLGHGPAGAATAPPGTDPAGPGAGGVGPAGAADAPAGLPPVPAAARAPSPPADGAPAAVLERARRFAAELLAGQPLDTGEDALGHAEGVAAIVQAIGGGPALCAAAYLVYAGDHLHKPEEVIARAFGEGYASLVSHTRRLVQIQRAAREAQVQAEAHALQTERVRKMLLAFSKDLRVVLLRLASRLQTLRWYAATKRPCPQALARETREVFAPLANRLGIWQIKWELEDLAFRFLEPEDYKRLARALAERRVEREQGIDAARAQLQALLAEAGLAAQVQGRPKHLWSIWKKMRGKGLQLERVFDMRALRVVVADIPACYAALAAVHARYLPLPDEYDDYIARPKPNGYQSLHTVVRGDDGRPMEVQIRTAAMHEHAEHGVAAHWAYKEAGVRGYAGVSAAGDAAERLAEARKAVLRQLLAWEREVAAPDAGGDARDAGDAGDGPVGREGAGPVGRAGGADRPGAGTPAAAPARAPLPEERIYVFTPQAAVIELSAGATPVDFAYALHTDLGHRCRGAKVDGVMVPLNTPLANGQTVEVSATREGGPSLDWLNPELGYLASPRARAKVRAWFNAQAQAATVARGREAVERLLQREGRTAVRLEELAAQAGFKSAEALFEVVGKDEYSLRNLEQLLRPPAPAAEAEAAETIALKRARGGDGHPGGVLVVGVESLLTQLARCCRPAPPDAIVGYVTRGKGVAIHREGCSNFSHMARQQPERVIPVAWGTPAAGRDGAREALYPVDVQVEATDRNGLLRDIGELLAKEKMHVIGAQTHSVPAPGERGLRLAQMTFTVEVADTRRLAAVLRQLAQLPGIRHARRR